MSYSTKCTPVIGIMFSLVIAAASLIACAASESDPQRDGDLSDGDMSDGDMSDGDVLDGDMVDGDMSDGDVIDGDQDVDVDADPCLSNPTLGCLWEMNENVKANCPDASDWDNDGLWYSPSAQSDPNCINVEQALGTNPAFFDTDRDFANDFDEIFQTYPIFPSDPETPVPDEDEDGLIDALDNDSDNDGEHDMADIDSDNDGVANYLEFFGYTWDWNLGEFEVWNGDVAKTYFKSDPMTFSTDQDHYSDGMEVSGMNMDVLVQVPGNHPAVVASPNIVLILEKYEMILNADITLENGTSHATGTNWSVETSSSDSHTDETGWEKSKSLTVGAEYNFPGGGVKAEVSIGYTETSSTSDTYTSGTAISNGGDVVDEQSWSKAVSMNPTEAAKIKMYVRAYNIGTCTAVDITPTFTLRVGDEPVTTFDFPGKINSLNPGEMYPAAGEDWIVDVTTCCGDPIFVTLDQMRAIETGAPVTLQITQMTADVVRWDADGGQWATVGNWDWYVDRAEAVSAHLFMDKGDGHTIDYMVFANRSDSAPTITLRDAMIWAAGGKDDPVLGPVVTFTPSGTDEEIVTSLSDWYFLFDKGTYDGFTEYITNADFNLLNIPLNENSVVIAKAPPLEPTPRVHWWNVTCHVNDGLCYTEPRTDRLSVYASDYFFKSEDLKVSLVREGAEYPFTWNAAAQTFELTFDLDTGPLASDRIVVSNPFYDNEEQEDRNQWRTEIEIPFECVEPPCKSVLIPAGAFMMGCEPEEKDCYERDFPRHEVNLSAYYMDMYEVTNDRYAAFLDAHGNSCETYACIDPEHENSHIHPVGDSWIADIGWENHPVATVSWYGAKAFCQWIGGRLPTEAEWEKAAKGADEHYRWPWGDYFIHTASNWLYDFSPYPTTTPVGYYDGLNYNGEFQTYNGASPYGLYDMAGNLYEWVHDWRLDTYYAESPVDDPQGPDTGTYRIARGGGYMDYNLTFHRATNRGGGWPDQNLRHTGFRCARDTCTDTGACLGGGTCPPMACHGHGECEPADGYCVCDHENMTANCAKCEDGYAGYPDCVAPSTWTDAESGLTWQNPPADVALPPEDAPLYCNGLSLGGFDDWRVPAITELRSLIRACAATESDGFCNIDVNDCLGLDCRDVSCDGCVNRPAADGCYWPDGVMGLCTSYWSSTRVSDRINVIWTVHFNDGSVAQDFDSSSVTLRCVRGSL